MAGVAVIADVGVDARSPGCEKRPVTTNEPASAAPPVRPAFGSESARAGWTLTLVTLVVLVVGIAVIRLTNQAEPGTESPQLAAGVSKSLAVPQPRATPRPQGEPIIVSGSPPTPTPLPPTGPDASGQAPVERGESMRAPFTAERFPPDVTDRR